MISAKQKLNKGILFIFLSSLMFGSYGVWSRLIGDSFGVFYQGYTRAIIICLILFPIIFYRKQIIPIQKKDWIWMVVFLIFTSATQAPIYYAFNHMDIGSATLLFFVTMLVTMYTVGFLFFKEKLTLVKVVSFVLALVGLYSIFYFSIEKFALLAAVMAVLNGIASGGEVSFSKKLSGSYSTLYLTVLSWLIIIVTNAALSFALGEKQLIPTIDVVWLYQIGYTVASLFAFWLIIEGLKSVEAGIGGLIGLLEIVFSIAFGIIIFGEGLTQRIILGGLLILIAASLPHVYDLVIKRK